MPERVESESRKLLGRLRTALAEDSAGQARLDKIVALIAGSMQTEVCSIYLFRDAETLELCATEGLQAEAVHKTRLRLGEGLVGRVARLGQIVNTADAPSSKGFRYMPETGEERFSSFCGVPIQRLGDALGVLVVQSRDAREFTPDEVYALEVVAMVIAEMTELGAFQGEGAALSARHSQPVMFRGSIAQEGASAGHIYLHEPRVVVTNPISDDPDKELERLRDAVETLRSAVDDMLAQTGSANADQKEVFEAYRMFAHSRSWMRRMEADVENGLSAEAAVEKEQSVARSRLTKAGDAYMRERLNDLDDLSNRLLRILTGQGADTGAEMPENPILVARNIGPGELLEYGKTLRGIILEEGSVGSHATIVARAWAIPLVINAKGITTEALNGDPVLVDGEQGIVHLRPDDTVKAAFADKIAMQTRATERYASIRDLPATTLCGETITLQMNAGLMADLPSLEGSGAEGVGLFRTELQFLIRNQMPKRAELSALYGRVIDAAKGKPVVFRTLDIGSDKVLTYMKPNDEPNPAMGWRAIRVGLDKPGILRMQLQALIRASKGGPLAVMFPFITLRSEFRLAKQELTNFISVGGNDLKQFFYAADRENERVRSRYDTLNVSFLSYLEHVVKRCAVSHTPLSFCGEDAGRPLEALCLAAIGFRSLSMRPASVGPIKHLLRRVNLVEAKAVIDAARDDGEQSVRDAVKGWLATQVGYLIAGIAISPILSFGGVDVISIQHFAEFGVVMMLFLVGLELEPKLLWQMRMRLLGLGGLQVCLTTLAVMAISMAFGLTWSIALAVGLVLALSSTAIVLQTLNEKGLMKSDGGQGSFSVLLFQDIAVIPMLALIPLLAMPELMDVAVDTSHGAEVAADAHGDTHGDDTHSGDDHGSGMSLVDGLSGWQTALVTLGAIGAVIVGGAYLTGPIFRFIAGAKLRELFTAAALMMVVGIALLMSLVGLSPALGTFLAGVVLANSEYRHELESDIDPFKGLLLGLFFMTVGAGIDFGLLFDNFGSILGLTLGLMALKTFILLIIAYAFKLKGSDKWLFALGLAQAGEFGFVLLSFTVANSVIPTALVSRTNLPKRAIS